MVTRTATTTRRTPARQPAAAIAGMRTALPRRMKRMKAQFEVAGRALERAGRAAGAFARSSAHEVTLAGRATREPMQAVWRAMRLAGRHIARDAAAAWREAVPVAAKVERSAKPRKAVRARAAVRPARERLAA